MGRHPCFLIKQTVCTLFYPQAELSHSIGKKITRHKKKSWWGMHCHKCACFSLSKHTIDCVSPIVRVAQKHQRGGSEPNVQSRGTTETLLLKISEISRVNSELKNLCLTTEWTSLLSSNILKVHDTIAAVFWSFSVHKKCIKSIIRLKANDASYNDKKKPTRNIPFDTVTLQHFNWN